MSRGNKIVYEQKCTFFIDAISLDRCIIPTTPVRINIMNVCDACSKQKKNNQIRYTSRCVDLTKESKILNCFSNHAENDQGIALWSSVRERLDWIRPFFLEIKSAALSNQSKTFHSIKWIIIIKRFCYCNRIAEIRWICRTSGGSFCCCCLTLNWCVFALCNAII